MEQPKQTEMTPRSNWSRFWKDFDQEYLSSLQKDWGLERITLKTIFISLDMKVNLFVAQFERFLNICSYEAFDIICSYIEISYTFGISETCITVYIVVGSNLWY